MMKRRVRARISGRELTCLGCRRRRESKGWRVKDGDDGERTMASERWRANDGERTMASERWRRWRANDGEQTMASERW
ncbi:hypothetical protein F2P81_026433 [Scophthalmus maximus]|uniref:Uncharacterized protein n=1 Tax=Scophthalmus maximus TaxID=52904 RepID=A0A6A4RRR9_SCOMX|nr:hypothetical protein F2P81_026433 [Scophthalmus maximus]